jgi:hypothetical protein
VVLAFVYYECPMLCTQVLNGCQRAVGARRDGRPRVRGGHRQLRPARDAGGWPGKKKAYIDRYKRHGAEQGFHFLTGSEAAIEALTDAAGFKYAWDEETQQFAHASGFVVATPDGKLSRYFFGIEYAPRDIKFALMESSAGRIGSLVDQVMLYCYHYDPTTGSYVRGMKAVRLGGAFTLLALGVRGCGASARTRAPGTDICSFGIPLFPEQASTFARDVDALYLFIIAVSAFFALAVIGGGGGLRHQVYRRGTPRGGGAHRGQPAPGAAVEHHPDHDLDGDVRVGRLEVFYTVRTPPAEALQIYAVGKQWMWKFQHLEGQREINELHVPVGRPVKVTMTSEDVHPQPVLPVVPHQDGRHSRPLHAAVVRGHEAWASTTSSAPSTAAPTTRG